MEVKIGVQFGTRELVIETEETAEDIERKLGEVLVKGGLFTLNDVKGSRVVVPVDKLAYVEIVTPEQRAVGFGRM